ncbi:hypothetical protein ATE92_1958 [Ulvibacter sp. MAR_2010_11]|uniref:lipocalin family protein n=1 Tax=Ulvibacter sp. MAR_2010_11 TaxID=1250229 RepID=UPI000C2CB4CB|nr:lipocalin family protein [Ulvibacter sp. MAR_2010_11]PKA83792.1 hypothetical protein ATE92_1958 [Ulvibacter sp. MAR_2010_11]
MKSFFYFLILFLVCGSCAKQDPNEQIQYLDGYWEIKSVTQPDGTKKDFGISTLIDFMEVTGDSGVRKKVAPRLDGSFAANASAEKFSLKIEDDSLRLYYTTPYDSWKETVLIAKDSMLRIKNSEDKIYTYDRFKSFTFSKE